MISIIVPVYNVEKYLRDCIESILAQTYTDWEMIMVNDGSTDHSEEIALECAGKDSRIKVVTQANGGLSAARNTGMRVATGQYLTFIDSDDAVAPEYLSTLLELLENYEAAIATCGFQRFSGVLPYHNKKIPHQKGPNVYSGVHALREVLYQDRGIDNSAWGKLYRRELWHDMEFPHGKLYEDLGTVPLILLKVDKVVVSSDQLYFYRVTPGSITGTLSKRRFDAVYMAEIIEKEIAALTHFPDSATQSKASLQSALRASGDRLLSASFNMLGLMASHPEMEDEAFRRRCENHISRLWKASLLDSKVRLKNKAGIIVYKFLPKWTFRLLAKRLYR